MPRHVQSRRLVAARQRGCVSDLFKSKNTQCVLGGSRTDPSTGGLNAPIHPSSAFKYLDMAENTYPRYFNTPNQRAAVAKFPRKTEPPCRPSRFEAVYYPPRFHYKAGELAIRPGGAYDRLERSTKG